MDGILESLVQSGVLPAVRVEIDLQRWYYDRWRRMDGRQKAVVDARYDVQAKQLDELLRAMLPKLATTGKLEIALMPVSLEPR